MSKGKLLSYHMLALQECFIRVNDLMFIAKIIRGFI